jgi:hypothetical protein
MNILLSINKYRSFPSHANSSAKFHRLIEEILFLQKTGARALIAMPERLNRYVFSTHINVIFKIDTRAKYQL